MDGKTLQAIKEGKICPIEINIDLNDCTVCNTGGDSNAEDSNGSTENAGRK